MVGVVDADEGDVVDLVRDVEQRRAGDRRLELARQVGVLGLADVALVDLVDGPGAVDDLVLGDPGGGRAEHDARGVAARLGGGQADAFEDVPDRRDVLDADPVVLDVLPVGDVGGAAGVPLGDLGDRAQLGEVEASAVDAHAQHEVLVVELVRFEHAGLAAVDPGLALRVEAPPAHAAAQVAAVDGVEAAVGVDVLDTRADVQAVVVLLELLICVERLAVAERPLALAAMAGGLAGPAAEEEVAMSVL